MARRMTKQVKTMVGEVNEYLKVNHIKDEADAEFVMMGWLLLRAGCYHGFNYFTKEGFLSGGRNEKFDHLGYYIW